MARSRFSADVLRRAAIPASIALAFSGIAFAQGFASAVGTSSLYKTAAALAPWHAKTKARAAELALVEGVEDGRFRNAADLAREALRREPTNAVALRTLGLASQGSGKGQQGDRQLVLADQLTRRDLPSQFYAIERAVGRNDIAGAIRHYDIAMRVNRESWPILMPVLVAATSNADIITPLATKLAMKPQWADPFLAELTAKGTSAPNALLLAKELGALGQPVGADVMSGIVSNLVSQKSWGLVTERALAVRTQNGDRSALVTDGDFAHAGQLPPIDWMVTTDGIAAVQSGPGKPRNTVLAYSLTPALETELARQIVTLTPGNYVITGTTGALDGAKGALAYFRIDCADGGGQRVADRANAVQTPQQVSARFIIPSNCGGQWLQIRVKSPDVDSSAGWIDDIKITRQ